MLQQRSDERNTWTIVGCGGDSRLPTLLLMASGVKGRSISVLLCCICSWQTHPALSLGAGFSIMSGLR